MDSRIVRLQRNRLVEACDCLVQATGFLQDDPEIVVAFRIIRLQSESFFEARNRVFRAIQAGQHNAAAIVRLGEAGIDCDGRVECFERLMIAAEALQG
ncbi:MAG: hypothetical protein WB495_17965 [Xanthobacteraceae bacterium]